MRPNIDKYDINVVYDIEIQNINTDFFLNNIDLDLDEIEVIKEEISTNNFDRPILLVQTKEGKFYLTVGIKSFRAFSDLKYNTIPARVIAGDLDDIKTLQMMLLEDFCPLQRAVAMQSYLEKYKLSRKYLSQVLDLKCNSISEILSLNKLPYEIKTVIINDKRFSLHHLREIARIKDESKQLLAFEKVRKKVEARFANFSNVVKNNPDTEAIENFPDPNFDFDKIKNYFVKLTNELKKVRSMYKKAELKRLRHEINEFNEELKALRYKISDDIFIEED